jgi:hypothetical protein
MMFVVNGGRPAVVQVAEGGTEQHALVRAHTHPGMNRLTLSFVPAVSTVTPPPTKSIKFNDGRLPTSLERETGAQGPVGERGEPGEAGGDGDPGTPGQTGAQGPAGERGERGETGAQGPAGERGERGESGEPGEKGEPGENGTARAYTVVEPSGTILNEHEKGIEAIQEPRSGVYCIQFTEEFTPSDSILVPISDAPRVFASVGNGASCPERRSYEILTTIEDGETTIPAQFTVFIL